MKGVIRLNDPLISGGKVTKASGADFMGQPVALKDDLAQCPLHKGTFAITECHPTLDHAWPWGCGRWLSRGVWM